MYDISLTRLVFILIPLVFVVGVAFKWKVSVKTFLYAISRMVIQLILLGYALIFIFNNESPVISSVILLFMLLCAAWISMRPLKEKRGDYFIKALVAISIGALPTLALIILAVIQLEPWYMPRYLIPLAGMIFAYGMNTVSLSAERYFSEINNGKPHKEARNIAFEASLIPLLNSFFAVGIVSIPGMMTGQILSGVSPLLAVRYQIMVMCMLLGASGIATAIFLSIVKK